MRKYTEFYFIIVFIIKSIIFLAFFYIYHMLEEGFNPTIKQYNDKEKTDLDSEYTAVVEFTNIILDEYNKTNISKIDVFSEEKDATYSLESIIQLKECNGYTKVKNKEV